MESANIIIAIIGGVIGIIGGIAGGVIYVRSSVEKLISDSISAYAENQSLKDKLCQQDRETIDGSLQTVISKNVGLEAELRGTHGVYSRLLAAEAKIENIKDQMKGN